jgi:hypothetical protein
MKRLAGFTLFILFLLFFASCNKNEITESWLRGANNLIRTTDGNMITAGYNISSGLSYQGCLTKLDNDGNVLWSYNYGTTNSDGFFGVANTSDGGYVATGYSYTSDAGSPNLIIAKVDASGNQEWLKTLTDYTISQGISVIPALDNSGYIAVGYMQESSTDDRDMLLVKFNNSGTKIWAKRYGGKSTSTNNYDEAYDIIAADNGYYVTGSVDGYSNCCGSAFLMRTNVNGDSTWRKTYSSAVGYSLARTTDDGVIIGGSYFTSSDQDYYLLKTTSDGTKQWEKQYIRSDYDYGTRVMQTNDGGYALVGNSDINDDLQIRLLKVDASGEKSWEKTFGGNNAEQAYGLIESSDGGFNISGLSNTGGSFVYLSKVSSDGSLIWEKRLQ